MIYLDNAATSFPKPTQVLDQTIGNICSPLGNPGRSGHQYGRKSAELVFQAREKIARLLSLSNCERVIFTGGATQSLNMAILGTVEEIQKRVPKPLVITSVFEHNSVLRPLFRLEQKGQIRLKILAPLKDGSLPIIPLLSPPPHLVVLTLKSNVTGRKIPIKPLRDLLDPYGTIFIGDGAQGVGTEEINLSEKGVHILCSPGHKGLFGIMGAGFMALSEDCPIVPRPILTGGSGTDSFKKGMSDFLPERFEAGTLPVPAIVSMGAGADFVFTIGQKNITRNEMEKKRYLLNGIKSLRNYKIYEPYFESGPLLINRYGFSSEETAAKLDSLGIFVRGGFHCAPLAHRFLGTEQDGAVRLSPGLFTTKEELDKTLNALESL